MEQWLREYLENIAEICRVNYDSTVTLSTGHVFSASVLVDKYENSDEVRLKARLFTEIGSFECVVDGGMSLRGRVRGLGSVLLVPDMPPEQQNEQNMPLTAENLDHILAHQDYDAVLPTNLENVATKHTSKVLGFTKEEILWKDHPRLADAKLNRNVVRVVVRKYRGAPPTRTERVNTSDVGFRPRPEC